MAGDAHENATHTSHPGGTSDEKSVVTMVVQPTGSVGKDEVHTILPAPSAAHHTAGAVDAFMATGFPEPAGVRADELAAVPEFGKAAGEPVTLMAHPTSSIPPIAETSGVHPSSETTPLSSGSHAASSTTTTTDIPHASEKVVRLDSNHPVE
jgi:hypothetical protein